MKKLLLITIGFFCLKHIFAQPVIKAFYPQSGNIGSQVTITGSGFSPSILGNVVFFGAVKADVISASSTLLKVIVPPGITAEPVYVTTQNMVAYANNFFVTTFPGDSAVLPINLYPAKKSFKIGKNPPGNINYGMSFFIHDLDGDGRADLVVSAPRPNKFYVFVLRNISSRGNVDFAEPNIIDSFSNTIQIVKADLNTDGKQDIILKHDTSRTVTVLLNNSVPGIISFNPSINLPVPEFPGKVVTDIDGDGQSDFVGLNGYNNTTFHMSIIRSIASVNVNSFGKSVNIFTGDPRAIAVGDVDNDSKPDIISASIFTNPTLIYIYKNRSTPGNIVIDSPVIYNSTTGLYRCILGDIDGDNNLDIISAENQHGTFSVLRNKSSTNAIAFENPQEFVVGRFPQSVSEGDVDGDGQIDVAVPNNNGTGRTVTIFKNNSETGLVKFNTGVHYYTDEAPYDSYITDVDLDGKPEIVFSQDDISIGVLLRCEEIEIESQPHDTTSCINTNVFFSIKTKQAQSYKWQVYKNGSWVDVADDISYIGTTEDTLRIRNISESMNGSRHRCSMLNKCGSNVFSNEVILNVSQMVLPTVQITTPSTFICQGQKVTFNATSTYGGTTPKYQWKKNNITVGGDKNEYTDSTIKDGDIIVCLLTSTPDCITNNTATSNKIVMNLSNQPIPQLTITSSDNNICFGTPVFFYANAKDTTGSVKYSWKKNKAVVGDNTSKYIDSSLNNGDTITCEVTCSLSCGVISALGNDVVMQVNTVTAPSIFINSSKNYMCPGEEVIFKSTVDNEDLVDEYIWQKNGKTVGSDLQSYTDTDIKEGEDIKCLIVSKKTECLTGDTIQSNILAMHIKPNLPELSLHRCFAMACWLLSYTESENA